MKSTSLIIAAVSMLFAACGGSSNGKLSGVITNGDGKSLILEKIENNAPVAVDSVKLNKEGKFEFDIKGKVDFYRLNLGNNNFVVLCLDSTNNAELKADSKSLNDTYTIKGSKNSELIASFFKQLNPLTKRRLEIDNELRGINFADTAKVVGLRNEMEQTMSKITEITHNFIDKNPESPSLIVMQSFLNPATELEYFKKIEAALGKSMPNSPYHNQVSSFVSQIEYQAQQLAQQKQMMEALKEGSPVEDIKLPDVNGKQMALSSLKGKVVLVDFWASWCAPCRAENPNVVRLYDKYNKKGFEVYSVSLDKDKEAWVAAIEKDGLKWPYHVSDLQQWKSSVVSQFGISGIPFTLLIDKQGNIIGKGLRGAELEQKLAEVLDK